TLPVPRLVSRFDHHIEAAANSLQKFHNLSEAEALFALEGVSISTVSPDVMETAGVLGEEIEKRHVMSPAQIIGTNRHNTAKEIAAAVMTDAPKKKRRDFDSLLTRGFPGIPILILMMVAILAVVFVLGGVLEELIVSLMTTFIAEPFHALGLNPFIDTIGGAVILALMSGLGIAFPYVFLFYIFISILEDTGYLTRAAFLADRAMHKIGLHGQGLIPLVLSFGCSVPAIMSTRLLSTKRERFIASVLVTMLPCSARTVVISGIVASFIGFPAAFSIYAIVFVLVFVVGCFLSKVTPGEQYGMILEMAELRRPIPKYVLRKAWIRVREFLYIAMPLLLISSVVLGIFEYLGWVALFETFIDPVSMAVLGLPGFAFTALMFGILRKEMAFETLAVMGGTTDLIAILSAPQLYIFALVCVLFVPCISTIAVLMRELGAKMAVIVTVFTLSLGVSLGALFHLVFMLF
ncbi:MAG: nucleoside recognition domain-containing protein, partial [Methanocorpusculum sp.]|nr:nucleoside recognition domain-containing protein [Methanocorpusculum sp.]